MAIRSDLLEYEATVTDLAAATAEVLNMDNSNLPLGSLAFRIHEIDCYSASNPDFDVEIFEEDSFPENRRRIYITAINERFNYVWPGGIAYRDRIVNSQDDRAVIFGRVTNNDVAPRTITITIRVSNYPMR